MLHPFTAPEPQRDETAVYQIRIKGHLDNQWETWFDGLTIKLDPDGNTLLTGLVADQSALYGHLKKVRDLGMPLISVIQKNEGER